MRTGDQRRAAEPVVVQGAEVVAKAQNDVDAGATKPQNDVDAGATKPQGETCTIWVTIGGEVKESVRQL